MAPRSYENIDVVLNRGPEAGTYEARIIGSPAGEAGPEPFSLTLSADRMALLLMQMAPGVIRSRRVAAPDTQATEELGGALFEALFHDSLRVALNESIALAPKGLRVRLRLNHAPELARLPWELLHDKGRLKFLALSERTPIVRYLDLAQPSAPLAITGPLRILTVIASPTGLPTLDVEAEWKSIQGQLAPLAAANAITIDRLAVPTLAQLRQWLRVHDVHVLHFIGHGEFDAVRDDGVLYFTDDEGNPRPVDPSGLGPHLSDHDPLRLVVLNACQTGRSADDDPFGGMAQGLVERGVPAVVAMQFPISDAAAVCFAGDFYASIAAGQPVDQALSGSRRALMDSSGAEWATPVLFMRSDSGELFDVAETATPPAEVPHSPSAQQNDVSSSEPRPAVASRGGADREVPNDVQVPAPGRTRTRGWFVLASVVAVVALLAVAGLVYQRSIGRTAGAGAFVPSPMPGALDPTSAASTNSSAGSASGSGLIPHVYNMAQADGLATLALAGFANVTSQFICSGSVANGRVRKVLVADEADNAVDSDKGSSPVRVPFATPLVVGVANGHPCLTARTKVTAAAAGEAVTILGKVSGRSMAGCPVTLWRKGPGDVEWIERSLDPPVQISTDLGYALDVNPSSAGRYEYQVRVPACNGANDAISPTVVLSVS